SSPRSPPPGTTWSPSISPRARSPSSACAWSRSSCPAPCRSRRIIAIPCSARGGSPRSPLSSSTSPTPSREVVMKLALVSLPWSMLTQPGAAIGALAAYVRREAPDVHVDARYEYVRVAARIGPRLYDGIAHRKHELGELLYTP